MVRITDITTAIAYLTLVTEAVTLTADGSCVVLTAACTRCGGTGKLPGYEQVEGGVCFACAGAYTAEDTREVSVIAYAREVKARRAKAARATAKRDLALAKRKAAQDAKEARIEAFRARDRAASTHLGTVGKRLEVEVTLVKRLTFDGTYGPTYLCIFKTDAGDVVVYKTGASVDVRDGQTARIFATVEAHAERDGVAQTIVQRVRVLAIHTGAGWISGSAWDAEDAAMSVVCGLMNAAVVV